MADVPPRQQQQQHPRDIWLLGSRYGPISDLVDPTSQEVMNFFNHFQSRLWITYRSGFEPISSTSLTSDAGWGCMLRSGQMLLAEALFRHLLGPGFRLGSKEPQVQSQYASIVTWFFDTMSNESPFSIHRIALQGAKVGKAVGQWFGPATISTVLRDLIHGFPTLNLAVHVPSDGVIYQDSLAELCGGVKDAALLSEPTSKWKSVLIMIPLRLGLDSVNPIYEEGIRACLRHPRCVGIAGGKPTLSYYFVGIDGDNLIYLDPHHTRPTLPLKASGEYTEQDLHSYHCHEVREVPISMIDPSLALGFYCRTKEEILEFLRDFQESKGQGPSLFSVDVEAPVYSDTLNSDQEDDGFDLV